MGILSGREMKEAGHAEDGQEARVVVRFVVEASTLPRAESVTLPPRIIEV